MNILLSIILLIIGLILLIKGSDIFVDAGSNIGKIFKMSEILIGLTIVCIGTSLPELVLSITGALNGSADLVVANILGSNIFNMCCILGLICVLNPLKLLRETIRKDMNMSLISSIALFVLLLDQTSSAITNSTISRTDGIILLLFFAIFLYYTFYEFTGYLRDKREKKYKERIEKKVKGESVIPEKTKEQTFTMKDMKKLFKNAFACIIGILMIHIGAQITVDEAVLLAEHFNVSESFISIVVIAVGTALPEISTSVIAVKKNRINIAIGNLIGSNMFNTLFILGTASFVKPLALSGNYLLVDAAVFVLICLVMRLFTKKKPEISGIEGFTLISIYIFYIVYVLFRR